MRSIVEEEEGVWGGWRGGIEARRPFVYGELFN